MSFDWEEYLQIARQHLGERVSTTDSARDRCAISRAYYAALIGTRDFVLSVYDGAEIGIAGDIHERLPKWCATRNDTRYTDIGQSLMRMRRMRNKADYETGDMPRLGDNAEIAVSQSQRVFSNMRALGRC